MGFAPPVTTCPRSGSESERDMDTSTTPIVTHELGAQTGLAVAQRKIAKYTKANDKEKLDKFLAAWRGHAQWANARNLLNKLGATA